MDHIVIRGGHRLKGEVRISGAKNAALPILASSLLSRGTSTYKNVPLLNDVQTMRRLIAGMGASVEPHGRLPCSEGFDAQPRIHALPGMLRRAAPRN